MTYVYLLDADIFKDDTSDDGDDLFSTKKKPTATIPRKTDTSAAKPEKKEVRLIQPSTKINKTTRIYNIFFLMISDDKELYLIS